MVKLPPERQAAFLELDPAAFVKVKGAWGKLGATNVRLKKVKEEALKGALEVAWQKTAENTNAKKKRK
jgi:uncharacterized protein involved in outer membrane biogenesis